MALTRKPRVGDRIVWPRMDHRGMEGGRVRSIDDDLCWVLKDGHEKAQPFIWRFHDGTLNTWHSIDEGSGDAERRSA